MTLYEAQLNRTYVVKKINSIDKEMVAFLFSLGCFTGEEITAISKLAGNLIINIKDARYSVDKELAKAIRIE